MLSVSQLSLAESITGILSAIGCFLVCLTFFTFPELRKKRYSELVFYVSLNVFIASIGISFGNTTSTGACWFQMISTNFNYLSGILWTSVIIVEVYLIVHYKRALTDQDMRYLHILCWCLPLLVTFLPLTTNGIGETDDTNSWCYVTNTKHSPSYGLLLWEILSFYLWVWIAIILNIACIISIVLQLRRMAVVSDNIYFTIEKLFVYPVILVFCWTGSTLIDIYSIFDSIHRHEDWRILSDTATIICILQGVFLSLSYFYLNNNIGDMWFTLFMVTFVDANYQSRIERESQDAIYMPQWRRPRGSKRSEIGDHPEPAAPGRSNSKDHRKPSLNLALHGNSVNNNDSIIRDNNNSAAAAAGAGGQDVEVGECDEGVIESTTTNSLFEFADRPYASEASLYYEERSPSSYVTPGSSFRDSEWGDGGNGAGSSSYSSQSGLSGSVEGQQKKQRQRSLGGAAGGVRMSSSRSSSRSSNVVLTPVRASTVAMVVEERKTEVENDMTEGDGDVDGGGAGGAQLSETVNPLNHD